MSSVDVVVTVTFTSSAPSTCTPTRPRVIALARDARKPSRVVRCDGSSSTGFRTWLAMTHDAFAPHYRLSRRAYDTVTVRVGDVEIPASPLAPALPERAHADEIVERQFGSLRGVGARAQLRFGRYDARDDTYALLDGAITIDSTHPEMDALAPALGAIAEDASRATRARAASVGKNPDVWRPRALATNDEGYVAGKRTFEYDWRGKDRHEYALAKMREDLDAYVPTRSEAEPMGEKMAERDAYAAALAAKIEIIRRVRDELIHGERENDDTNNTRVVVGPDTITRLYETCVITNSRTGERRGVRDSGVYLDDIQGCDANEIDVIIQRTRKELELTRVVLHSMIDELRERIEWDNIESGVETRDVLENGVRREHMENLLGRQVTKADVDASLKIPAKLRARLVGGYDIEASRRTGKYIVDADRRGRIAES